MIPANKVPGILFFLKNHRPNGQNTLIGAGVATVSLSSSNVPNATRLAEYWWDANTEPWYGDIGALRAGEYVYAYGHATSANHVYVARVNYTQATQLDSYEYWNGQAWQSDRLYNVSDTESVMWGVDQGQVFWSNYYGCFVFVYCGMSNFFWDFSCDVFMACSSKPGLARVTFWVGLLATKSRHKEIGPANLSSCRQFHGQQDYGQRLLLSYRSLV